MQTKGQKEGVLLSEKQRQMGLIQERRYHGRGDETEHHGCMLSYYSDFCHRLCQSLLGNQTPVNAPSGIPHCPSDSSLLLPCHCWLLVLFTPLGTFVPPENSVLDFLSHTLQSLYSLPKCFQPLNGFNYQKINSLGVKFYNFIFFSAVCLAPRKISHT